LNKGGKIPKINTNLTELNSYSGIMPTLIYRALFYFFMDKDTVKKVMSEINPSSSSKAFSAMLNPKNYSLYEITKESAKKIIPAEKEFKNLEMLFIDGGNAEIFATPRASLQAVRLYGCVFKGNKRMKGEKYEFYALSVIKENQSKLNFSVSLYPAGKDKKIPFEIPFENDTAMTFSADDKGMSVNGNPSPSRAIDAVRRLFEIKLAKSMAESLKQNSIVVLDGTLEANYFDEEKTLESLYTACSKNNISICGLSKTSKILTKDAYSVPEKVSSLLEMQGAEAGRTGYVKIADSSSSEHQASIYFAKMHEKSSYVFRIDAWNNNHMPAGNIISCLSANSGDLSFPGYPYGLIHADRFARISNNEKQYFKTLFMSRAGKEWNGIMKQVSLISAHSVLDSM